MVLVYMVRLENSGMGGWPAFFSGPARVSVMVVMFLLVNMRLGMELMLCPMLRTGRFWGRVNNVREACVNLIMSHRYLIIGDNEYRISL
jgi:hypothetical protein